MGKLKLTTVRVDEEDLKLAKALGLNLSALLREAIRRVTAGGREEFERWLGEKQKELQERFKRMEETKPCPRCGKPMRLIVIMYTNEYGKEVGKAKGWKCDSCGASFSGESSPKLEVKDEWESI
jgi:post-segregation antitoxin (ccd killing protein)